MRLYLSSVRLGNQPQKLVEMTAGRNRALVVANACDLFIDELRLPRLERELKALRGLGFQAEELDLRHYFGTGQDVPELGARLESCGLIWVRGGNPFVLRRAMQKSGFDKKIVELLGRDALVYGGYSGGTAVLGPSLHGVDLASDPVSVPKGYEPDIVWDGLGIINYSLAPHYQSNHPATPAIEHVIQYFIEQNLPYKVLRDGQVMVISGDQETLLS